jgi:hypothetical protein
MAVDYARRAYEIEVACRLEQRLCREVRHKASPNKRVFILSNGTIVQYGAPLEFLRNADARIWHRQHHAFINLGRSALVDVSADIIATAQKGQEVTETIVLGCIGADNREIHVAIYWHDDLGRMDIRWKNARHGDSQRLEFYPEKVRSTERSLAIYRRVQP